MSVNMAAVYFESIQHTLSWLCEISLDWLKIGPKNAHFIPVWVKFDKSYIPQIFVESSLFEIKLNIYDPILKNYTLQLKMSPGVESDRFERQTLLVLAFSLDCMKSIVMASLSC